jgi:transposase-like protein
MRNKYTAEQREKLVEEVRATGARVVDVAKRMGIAPSAAYVWLKRSSPAASAPSAPVFARVVPAQPPTAHRLVLELGAIRLHVEADFDPVLLRQVIVALGEVT